MLYQVRFYRCGAVVDVDRSISLMHQANAAYPDRYLQPTHMNPELGLNYFYRFLQLGAVDDLERATHEYRAAATTIPKNHRNRRQ